MPWARAFTSVTLVSAVAMACGPVRPPLIDVTRLEDPSIPPWTGEEPDATVTAAPPPAPALPATAQSLPLTPRIPVSTAGCPLAWTPQDVGRSVLVIPKGYAARFMIPVVESACACVVPGEYVQIVARIIPETGHIEAWTGAREDDGVKPSSAIDACLKSFFAGTPVFETFEVGSDVVVECPEKSPPPGPGAAPTTFFEPPRTRYCAARKGHTTIVYPLLVDRRREARIQ